MSGTVREAVNLLEILPEQEQDFALEFIKISLKGWVQDAEGAVRRWRTFSTDRSGAETADSNPVASILGRASRKS